MRQGDDAASENAAVFASARPRTPSNASAGAPAAATGDSAVASKKDLLTKVNYFNALLALD